MRDIKFRGKVNSCSNSWVHGYLANEKYINRSNDGEFDFVLIKKQTTGKVKIQMENGLINARIV